MSKSKNTRPEHSETFDAMASMMAPPIESVADAVASLFATPSTARRQPLKRSDSGIAESGMKRYSDSGAISAERQLRRDVRSFCKAAGYAYDVHVADGMIDGTIATYAMLTALAKNGALASPDGKRSRERNDAEIAAAKQHGRALFDASLPEALRPRS